MLEKKLNVCLNNLTKISIYKTLKTGYAEKPTTDITLAELSLYEWKEMGLQGRASFASAFDDNEFHFVFGGEAYGLPLFLEPFIKLVYNIIWLKHYK